MWYVVYLVDSGEPISFGTVLSDRLPDDVAILELDDSNAQMILDGTGIWNTSTLKVDAR